LRNKEGRKVGSDFRLMKYELDGQIQGKEDRVQWTTKRSADDASPSAYYINKPQKKETKRGREGCVLEKEHLVTALPIFFFSGG
jgi:hypothetical protein